MSKPYYVISTGSLELTGHHHVLCFRKKNLQRSQNLVQYFSAFVGAVNDTILTAESGLAFVGLYCAQACVNGCERMLAVRLV